MKKILNERHEDLVNMLVRCRIKIDEREDPTALDIATDMRALPGIVTVRQTRPISDPVTSDNKRIIELNVSFIQKYISENASGLSISDATIKVLKMLKTIESVDIIKLVDHDDDNIAIRTNKSPIIL